MICPRCSFNILGNQQVCPRCHLPAPLGGTRVAPPTIQEPRHKLILAAGIGAIVTGVCLLGASGAALLGIIALVCGVTTLSVSKFGKVWDNLTPGKKALAIPGVIAGIAGGAVVYIMMQAILIAFKMQFPQD